ncbi:hypothetical protein CL644_01640 [bacterium]|nr:hypothetical protein [bacterium]
MDRKVKGEEGFAECKFNANVGGITPDLCRMLNQQGPRAPVCSSCECPFKTIPVEEVDPFELVILPALWQGRGRYG